MGIFVTVLAIYLGSLLLISSFETVIHLIHKTDMSCSEKSKHCFTPSLLAVTNTTFPPFPFPPSPISYWQFLC